MQSFSFTQPPNMVPAKSPVFDFDDVWADHVLTLRTTAKASLDDESTRWLQQLPMEGVSPTATASWHGVKNPECGEDYYYPNNNTQWTTTMAPVAHHHHPPVHHLMSDLDSWAAYGSGAMMYPNNNTTFEGYMMPIDQTSSTTSISTFESDSSSPRGSKRPSPSSFSPSSSDGDEPLEFSSSKAKRPRLQTQQQQLPSPLAAAKEADGQAYYETLQGPWTLPNIPPPPLPTGSLAIAAPSPTFVSVRPMPTLRIPVPRLPQQIWSAAAALGNSA